MSKESITKKHFEVDQAMLGHEFCGDMNDLETFCEILEEKLKAEVKVIPIKSLNGADDNTNAIVSMDIWNNAIDEHAKEYPEAWIY